MACFVFDWDDTLLPTSYLQKKQYFNPENGKPTLPLSLEDTQYLTILASLIALLLQTCLAWGPVFIITNGQHGWVQDSTQQFLPSLLPFLDDIEVISARSRYEDQHPGDYWRWKFL